MKPNAQSGAARFLPPNMDAKQRFINSLADGLRRNGAWHPDSPSWAELIDLVIEHERAPSPDWMRLFDILAEHTLPRE